MSMGSVGRFAGLLACVLAIILIGAISSAAENGANRDPLLHQVGTIDTGAILFKATGYGQLAFVRSLPNSPGELVTFDLRSGQSQVLAKPSSYTVQSLYWTDRYVLFGSPMLRNSRGAQGERTDITLVERASGRTVKRWQVDGTVQAATIVGDIVQVIRRNSSGDPEGSTIFSLKTLKEVASDTVPGWTAHPLPVFWGDRILLIYNDSIYLYTNRFERLASAPGPVWTSRGQFGCSPSDAKIFGKRLIFTGCGGFGVFDLDKF